jgi:hypothetical protein
MKKILLLFATILFTVVSINAQDLSLSWDGKTLGETVTVWGEPNASQILFHAIVHNNSDNGINVMVRRTEIDIVAETQNNFKWGFDYPPQIDESTSPRLIFKDSQSADDEFIGYYDPNSKMGTSTIEYMFFNKDNEGQNVKVVVKYWTSPDGIAEDAMKHGAISDIYPNPATNTINLDYVFSNDVNSASVSILNLLGAVVKEAAIDRNANKFTLDVSELQAGIYFYTVLVNKDVYQTKKLIIQQ